MSKKIIKSIITMLTCFMMCLSLTGCVDESQEELIKFEKYKCSDSLKNNVLTPSTFYLVTYGLGTRYEGYQYPSIQVDDKCFITLGTTTLGEIVAMLTGVSVEEQINNAKEGDEGKLKDTPEKIEANKKKQRASKEKESKKEETKDTEQEENKKKQEDKQEKEESKEESPYSFYLKLDDGETRSYAPIYLISSEQIGKETVLVYKHGIPYIQFNFSNYYQKNRGIRQESALIITGVEMLATTEEYADKDGFNKAAKKNTWVNGGLSFSGDGLEYTTMPNYFESLGLPEGDGYRLASEYFTRTDNEKFYYCANLYGREPVYTDTMMFLYKSNFKFMIDRETQKITSLSVNLEEANSYYRDSYSITTTRPEKVVGEF